MPKRQVQDPMTNTAPEESVDPLLQRQQHLSAQLRSMFSDVVHEEVPAEFRDLLDRLDQSNENST